MTAARGSRHIPWRRSRGGRASGFLAHRGRSVLQAVLKISNFFGGMRGNRTWGLEWKNLDAGFLWSVVKGGYALHARDRDMGALRS